MAGITQAQFNQIQIASRSVATMPNTQQAANTVVFDGVNLGPLRTPALMDTPPFDEISALPYGQDIGQGVANLLASGNIHAAGYDSDKLVADIQGIITDEFSNHLKTLPAGSRIAAFDQLQPIVDAHAPDASAELQELRQTVVFVEGLGATQTEFNALVDGSTTIQDVIGAHTKEELFEAFEAVDPEASALTGFLETEPAMGEALRDAIIQNPNVLPTITRLAESGRLSQIGDYLADADPSSPIAGIAKQKTIDALRALADDPTKDTAELEGLLNMAGGFDFGAILDFFKDIMDGVPVNMAVADLIDDLGLTGDEAESVEYFGTGIGKTFGLVMGGTTAYGGIYHEDSSLRQGLGVAWEHAQNIPGISGVVGATVGFQTDVAATVTYDPAAFSAEFSAATSSIDFSDGVQVNELLESLDHVATIEPSSADEVAAIKHLATTDPAVQAQFSSYGGMTKADLARSFDKLMKDLSRPDPSTGVTATPREAAMSLG